MKTLLIATSNKGKIREIKNILRNIPYRIITLSDINLTLEVTETGKTFEENAIIKAKAVGNKTKMFTLAEDSGLEVDFLDKRPGVLSARYCVGSDLDRINKLLEELEGVPRRERTASFRAVVALFNPETNKISTYTGISKGYITQRPIGKNGFGYDPVFFNIDLGKTNGQASSQDKNRVSHRARALRKVIDILRTSAG